MTQQLRGWVLSFSLLSYVVIFNTVLADISETPTCTSNVLQSLDVFNCVGRQELNAVEFGPATAYLDSNAREAFPQSWQQHSSNQRHNPVFPAGDSAPPFIKDGTVWTAALTGLDYVRLAKANDSMRNDEAWGSRAAQYSGNVVGVSVAQGIVYVPLGRNEIWALDAASGKAIWQVDVPTAAGMGQVIAEEINGRLMVFAPAGDAAFTIHNVIDFTNGKPHDRGAAFTGIYAYDGVTGEALWRFATKGTARPTPVYYAGKIYLTTNGGDFFVLDAASGAQVGQYTNPNGGFTGLASPNWYKTDDGRLLLIYGIIRPRRILAVDATDATQPFLAWAYNPVNATANAPGDTSVAVDPDLGMVFTTVFSSVGGQVTNDVVALDAATGALRWNDQAGGLNGPPGYKGSVPMVHDGILYVGNTSNGHFLSYDAATGAKRWDVNLAETDDPAGILHRPRAAPVFYNGKVILAEGRDIHTFDPDTGEELNRFETPGSFSRWGINQPTIIGKLMILSSPSGWVFAAPVDLITSLPGYEDITPSLVPVVDTPIPAQQAEYVNPGALPSKSVAAPFPSTWLAYAGGQDHNAVVAQGPQGQSWQTALNDSLPLDAPVFDNELYGTEIATQMSHWAFGVGSGVSAANGILYVGSDAFSVNAINALTGEPIWRYRTTNANFGQPIVTANTVIVSNGDPWMNLGNTGRFRANSPATFIGDRFSSVQGLDPLTGEEKWTVFSGNGSSAMTPLYHNGNLYWINGEAKVYAVNADSGEPVSPFMDMNGLPTLSLGGFNAISSANIYNVPGGPALMIVGTAMPNRLWAIDLETATVVWSQAAADINSYITGFATASPVVQQSKGIVVTTVLADADLINNSIEVIAIALDGKSGEILWQQLLGRGAIPAGFVSPTPMIKGNQVFVHNPLTQTISALNSKSGELGWETQVSSVVGKYSWAPGVVTGNRLIVPVGEDLYTLKANNGDIVKQHHIGGAMVYNNPSVVGNTLYVGNSWGWISAIPLNELLE